MKIVFTHPSVKVDITNKQVHLQEYEGHNHLDRDVEIVKVTKGCSCTSIDYPKVIPANSDFKVWMSVDKTYVQEAGFYASSATLIFNNGEEQTLYIKGRLLTE